MKGPEDPEGTELWFPGELGADGTSGPRVYKD